MNNSPVKVKRFQMEVILVVILKGGWVDIEYFSLINHKNNLEIKGLSEFTLTALFPLTLFELIFF